MNVNLHDPVDSSQRDHLNLSTGSQESREINSESKRPKEVEVYLVSSQGRKKLALEGRKVSVEQLMQRLYIENRDFFKNESIYDLNFYVAKKSGEPKDDIPG